MTLPPPPPIPASGSLHVNVVCVWCQRQMTGVVGALLPGRVIVVARWNGRVGYACRISHKEMWEMGPGTSYAGTDYGDAQERVWMSRSW